MTAKWARLRRWWSKEIRPLLILALSDSNPQIMHTANSSLQYLSRRLVGYELNDHPSAADRQALIDKWKAWYLSVRPDAAFLN